MSLRIRPLLVSAVAAALAAATFTPASPTVVTAPAQAHDEYRVLVFSKVTNFVHDSIPAGVEAVQELGEEHHFEVVATDDAGVFTDESLAGFDTIVFNNTNSTPESGDLLDGDQRAAFQRYVQDGGGWVGVHAASASERDWEWYEGLVGAIFDDHPAIQPGRVEVLDRQHPSTRDLPELWEWTEEWYNWTANPYGNVHTLAEIAVDDGIEGLDEGLYHPISWCQRYDGGRSWFTGLGHAAESFADPTFRSHLLGGIEWTAGVAEGDCGATQTASFDKVPLVTEDLSDPFELAVTPDRDVVYVERTGQVKVLDQATLEVTTALDFDYDLDLTSQSDGLLGLALDADFAENRWLYLFWSDKVENEINLSRFTLGEDNTIAMDSEARLLEVPTWRGEGRANSHMAGSLAVGPDGDLYVATGDNTDPFQSEGFTPIDEREGRRAYDAQATSGNTNDLRGKVLRITPEDDGTYSIPEGNLFAPGTEDTRPEVYLMGLRNPFRITVDPQSNALLVGDYGPDSRTADAERGPAGLVEYLRVTEAGNEGWPYCVGENIPYNDYDFASGASGAEFDCAALVNDSPNNTGLAELPPARSALITYGYDESPDFPELGAGGAGPMAGPVYDYDPELDVTTKFPEYYDGKWFIYELTRNWFRTISLHTEDATFENPDFDDRAAGDLLSINPFLSEETFVQPFDSDFGPDGSLYILEFGVGSGSGRGGSNDQAGIYRVDYVADGRPPQVQVQASPDSGPAPLEVEFSSEGTGSPSELPITYAWDFDGDGEVDSTEANPTHTYTEVGSYRSSLTVTDSEGATGIAAVTITVGNTRPEVAFSFPGDGGLFEFGDQVPYAIDVVDAEDGTSADGEIDCERVTVGAQLGHDDHAHPFETTTGCENVVQTDVADHGAGQNLYWVLAGAYQDEGAEGAPELTGEQRLVLQPRNIEAEHADRRSGGAILDREDARGGRRVGDLFDGDWIAFDPIDLAGAEALSVSVSSGGLGGTVEVRLGAPDGELVGEIDVPAYGDFTQVRSPTIPIAAEHAAAGSTSLYLVVRGEGPETEGLLALDWLVFHGRGAANDVAPVVEASASGDGTEAPAAFTFDGSATAPEGREVVDYHWDFGDGSTAEGAEATHTYAADGRYTARLTATDDEGAHDWAWVEVVVGEDDGEPGEPTTVEIVGVSDGAELGSSELLDLDVVVEPEDADVELGLTVDGEPVDFSAPFPAAELGLGERTLVASATDADGEVVEVSVTVTVTTSMTDLDALITHYASTGDFAPRAAREIGTRFGRAERLLGAGDEAGASAALSDLAAWAGREPVVPDVLVREVLVENAEAVAADLTEPT